MRARLARATGWLLPTAIIASSVGLWALIASTKPPYVLAGPDTTFRTLSDDWDVLGGYTVTTIKEFVIGFFVGIFFGFVLAVVMAHFELVRRGVYPILIGSQAVPVIAIGAPLTIWLGFGLEPKLAIVALIVFFPVVVNVLDGLAGVDQDLISLARSMGAGPGRIFLHIRLPATMTPLFSAIKLGAVFGVSGALFGEWVASETPGIGNYLLERKASLDVAGEFAAIFLLAVIGITAFLLVVGVERLLSPWRTRSTPYHLRFRREATGSTRPQTQQGGDT